jgi:fructose-1,6-bisphosphatase I
VLSEEEEAIQTLSDDGLFDVVMDPIDGSDSIGIGASLGMLFAIFPTGEGFAHTGREIIAAGYVHFGHCIEMGFSVGREADGGHGLCMAAFDRPADVFRVTQSGIQLPSSTNSVAFNASNVRRWPRGLQRYIAAVLKGQEGPRGRDFNMRWLAAAVGELHRIVERGGVFMYPADPRPGYEEGRLRLLYEAFPIAWLIEQAGGTASDGKGPILDRVPTSLHENTPLFFGARDEMAVLLQSMQGRSN